MSNEISKNLKQQISLLENVPGVYQFYDISESLLYVGKAKKLKNRVSSYFNKIKFENRKTQVMVQEYLTNIINKYSTRGDDHVSFF